MNRDVILNAAVDEQAPLICKTAEVTGSTRNRLKEWKTSAYLNKFTDLGYELVKTGGYLA
ncbi:MAG: hypothetical protein ACLVJ6_03220 [Merdibacter sp.]